MRSKFLLLLSYLLITFSQLQAQINPSDNCGASAALLTVTTDCSAPNTGSTAGLTNSSYSSTSGTLTGCGAGGDEDDDGFYRFVATSPATQVTVDGGIDFDAVVSVGPDCTGANKLDCSNATGVDGIETLTVPTVVGNTYYIHLYDYATGAGSFTICVSAVNSSGMGSSACSGLTKLCTDTGLAFDVLPSNGTGYPGGNNYGCLGTSSSPRLSWFYIEIQNPGAIDITMTAQSDVDFALWGPYTSLAAATSACGSLPAPIDCGFSPVTNPSTEVANIPSTATTGQIYILLITNYWATAQTITVSQTGGAGSTNCDGITTCSPALVPAVDITQTSVPICANGIATLNYTVANGPANLSKTGTGILSTTTLANGTSTFTYTPSAADAGTTVTITASIPDPVGPCTSATDNVNIVVNPAIAVTPTATPSAICAGDISLLSATVTGGTGAISFAWNNGAGSGSPVSVSPASNTTYTVTASDANLCTASNTVAVAVNTLPNSTFNLTGGGVYCAGGAGVAVGLSGSQVGISYQLQVNNINIGSAVAGTGAAISFGNQTTAGNYTVVATNTITNCNTILSGGSVAISIHLLPISTFNLTGGGVYCAGGTGVLVGLSGSEVGISYQLQVNNVNTGAAVAGTGVAISFGNQTVAGTYTVVATNTTTGCNAILSGGAIAVSINTVPTSSFNLTGGGTYCAGGTGVAVGLSGSQVGISYQLQVNNISTGSAIAGTGAAISFGSQLTAGNYTVLATNTTTGCNSTLSGGGISVFVNALPTSTYNLTGGGAYCAGGTGVAVGLSGSDAGVSYQLQVNNLNTGVAVAGTGSAISFGNQTIAGTYTVVATNTTTNCNATLSNGNISVTINTLPNTTYNITGGGAYCAGGAGVAVGLDGSEVGINYQLQINGTNVGSAVAGTGVAISFGNQTLQGFCTIIPTNTTTGCNSNISSAGVGITINTLPNSTYTLSGGGAYCAGGTGLSIDLSGSEVGISYQLQVNGNNIGSPIIGTGAALSFGNQTQGGTYTLVATNTITSCNTNIANGAVGITVNSLPTSTYNLTGGGAYCAGGIGVAVGLSGSEVGINYELQVNGVNTGITVAGTGAAITFGNQTQGGTYTVLATNTTTGCNTTLSGGAVSVIVNTLPNSTYTLTGGGAYCAGGVGLPVCLSGSEVGIAYQLQVNGNNIGNVINGNGSAICFGSQVLNGNYSVIAINTISNCNNAISNGNIAIVVNNLPSVAFNIGGGGNYCGGGAGVLVDLSGSQVGINYQLQVNNVNIGAAVGGTGNSISFGNQTTVGNYTVVATNVATGCNATIGNGNVSVGINPLPISSIGVRGGGIYCSGTAGVAVSLDSSEVGVNYQLYLNGASTPNIVAGTGNPISFGLQTAVGTYTVVAINANTLCSVTLTGGGVSVLMNTTPTASISGTTSICAGNNTNITFTGTPNATVIYDVSGIGTQSDTLILPASGTTTINTGALTTSTNYILVDVSNGICNQPLTTSANITVNALPTANISGTTTICSGANTNITFAGTSGATVYYNVNGGASQSILLTGGMATLNTGALNTNTTYNLESIDDGTCSQILMGNVTVSINALPNTAYSLTGGGAYCAGGTGVMVDLSGSDVGISYQLQVNGSPIGAAVAGTGTTISFGSQTQAGIYTIFATNTTTGCNSTLSNGNVSISINILPTSTYTLTGGGAYCAGGTGVVVGLSGSEAGISYQLQINGANVGFPVASTGSAISFGNQTIQGVCTIVATNTATGCNSSISNGSVSITANPLPISTYTLTGGGAYCAGGTGVVVGLSSSDVGILYQLQINGTNVGSSVAGTGVAISFGNQTIQGVCTIVATNTITGCNSNISNGNVSVTVNPLPISTYTLTGGGAYCAGGNGIAVNLSGSQLGISYQLQVNGANIGFPFAGTGNTIAFGNQTVAGNYTVMATNTATACNSNISTGNVSVSINPTPTNFFTLTGGGVYCAGGTGVVVGLSGSQVGVDYILQANGTNVSPLVTGTGNALSFGNQTTVGNYSIVAINTSTGCSSAFANGNISINTNPLPNTSFNLTGGGVYCAGTAVLVGLSGSEIGINYQLQANGANVSPLVTGTGSAISFGMQTTVGNYSVIATNPATGCVATATAGGVSVSQNPLPTASISATSNICLGASGTVTFTGTPNAAVYYSVNGTSVSTPIVLINGTALLNTGAISATTTYALVNVTDGSCSQQLNASATVTVGASVTVNVAAPQNVCEGGAVILQGNPSAMATNFLWTTTSGSFSNAATSVTAYYPAVSSGVVSITFSATDASGFCQASSTVNITVTPAQNAAFTYPTNNYCQSSNLNPAPNIPSGNYGYNVLSTMGALTINASTGEIDLQNSLPGTYQVVNILPNNTVCPADTAYQFINIEATPNASFAYDKNVYCGSNENPILLQSSGQLGMLSYLGTPNALTLNANTGGIDLSTSMYGTYSIINTVNGLSVCPAAHDTFSLTYAPKPVAAISPSGTFDFCTIGNLLVQATGGISYQWLRNGATIAGANTDNYQITQEGYYSVIAYNQEGCSDTSNVVIMNIGNAPDASIKTNGNTTFCEGGNLLLTSVSNSVGTYQWLRNGVVVSNNTNQYVVTDAANYQLVISNGCGSDTSSIIGTYISATPTANFTWSPEIAFVGQPVIFSDSSTNAATWSWYFGDGQIEYEENPTNIYQMAGAYSISMHVWNEFGCDSFITKNIIVYEKGLYFIPNIFTPNGDGAFDSWQVEAEGFKDFELEVYDRWGQLMFSSDDLNKQWNGNTQGGRACQNGVYFYHVKMLDYKNNLVEEKGNVTLLR